MLRSDVATQPYLDKALTGSAALSFHNVTVTLQSSSVHCRVARSKKLKMQNGNPGPLLKKPLQQIYVNSRVELKKQNVKNEYDLIS